MCSFNYFILFLISESTNFMNRLSYFHYNSSFIIFILPILPQNSNKKLFIFAHTIRAMKKTSATLIYRSVRASNAQIND